MVSLNGVSRQVGGAPQEIYSRPSVARRPRLLHRVDWLHLCKYFVNVCRFLFPFFFFFTLPFARPPDEWRGDSPSSAWCSPDRRARSDPQLFPAGPVIFSQSPPPSHLLPALRLDPSEPAHFGRSNTSPCGAVYNGVSYWSCRVWNLIEVLLFCCFGAAPPGTSPLCFHFCSPGWCLLPGERVDRGFLEPSLAG